MKKKLLLMSLLTSALTLAGCGGSSSSSIESKSSSSTENSSSTGSTSSSSTHSSDSSSSTTSSSQSGSSGSGSSSSSASSSSSGGGSSSSSLPQPTGNVSFSGTEAATVVKGHFFDSLKGVKATSENGLDLSGHIVVDGMVQYGKIGTYVLKYSVNEGEASGTIERSISVVSGTFKEPTRKRTDGAASTIAEGSGSYRTGAVKVGSTNDGNEFHRPSNPSYIDNELYDEGPIPTNRFWGGFTSENYGGISLVNTGTLYSSFSNNGLSISNRLTGFTQYFSVNDTFGKAQTTIANFAPVFKDITIKPSSLNSSFTTVVTDYDATSVSISARNNRTGNDEMHVRLDESSPYIVMEFADPSAIKLHLRQEGVTNAYEYYDLNGNLLTGPSSGEGYIIKIAGAHSGYATTYPSVSVGAALYSDLYYLVSTPKDSSFTFTRDTHPNEKFLDLSSTSMTNGNYMIINAMNSISEAKAYHEHAYSVIRHSSISNRLDEGNSLAYTDFSSAYQRLDGRAQEPLLALLPHQWRDNSSLTLSSLSFKNFRGINNTIADSAFSWSQSYAGILPSFTLPTDSTFSKEDASAYIDDLLSRTVPGTVSKDWDKDSSGHDLASGKKNFMNACGPYWNAKAIYPLSVALIASDQMGLTEKKSTIITRLRDDLADWFTYSGESDLRYLYYDNIYGSMYYSTDNFSTGSRLSDHHFTAGYLIYASAVLAMYDSTFLGQYGAIAKLLLLDYMNDGESDKFSTFRGYDAYASHSYADGIGDFGDGNDQESCGEALNSWAAGYLFALATGDESLAGSAIWGFANELAGVKEYWFNYNEDNWIASFANYTHVVGVLWSGKNECATWFGSNPEFIYGIHWLPTGEYLSSYALGTSEKAMLSKIYNEFLGKVGGSPRTWMSNMWAMQALIDPSKALSNFSASKILADDYPNELIVSYMMVHSLASLGDKETSGNFKGSTSMALTCYTKNGSSKVLSWNPTGEEKTATYVLNGESHTIKAPARSFLATAI